MRVSLEQICTQFTLNREVVRETFRWEPSELVPVCANLFCSSGRTADAQALREARDLIRHETGVFSNFRGNLIMPLSCMLSLKDQPEETFRRAQDNYRLLKEEFRGSIYLALTAFLLTDRENVEDKVREGRAIYRRMKEEHRFLTSSEDSVFAVMLAYSGKGEDALVQDMEACYDLLKQTFHDSDCMQTVSHVLAMDAETPEKKTMRLISLYEALWQAGLKYGRHYEVATLAALSMMHMDTGRLVEDMRDVDQYLSTQRGYGILGHSRKSRLMHAAMLVSDESMEEKGMQEATLTSTLSMVIAQQMAVCAALAASSAAAASSSSH